MHALQGSNLLWPRVVQVLRDGDVAKVDRKVVAPHGEPLEVTQCLSLGQRQRNVLVTVLTEDSSTASLISQTCRSIIVRTCRSSHVEVGGY